MNERSVESRVRDLENNLQQIKHNLQAHTESAFVHQGVKLKDRPSPADAATQQKAEVGRMLRLAQTLQAQLHNANQAAVRWEHNSKEATKDCVRARRGENGRIVEVKKLQQLLADILRDYVHQPEAKGWPSDYLVMEACLAAGIISEMGTMDDGANESVSNLALYKDCKCSNAPPAGVINMRDVISACDSPTGPAPAEAKAKYEKPIGPAAQPDTSKSTAEIDDFDEF